MLSYYAWRNAEEDIALASNTITCAQHLNRTRDTPNDFLHGFLSHTIALHVFFVTWIHLGGGRFEEAAIGECIPD